MNVFQQMATQNYVEQAEVELRLTQAEAVRLQYGCELSILLN